MFLTISPLLLPHKRCLVEALLFRNFPFLNPPKWILSTSPICGTAILLCLQKLYMLKLSIYHTVKSALNLHKTITEGKNKKKP